MKRFLLLFVSLSAVSLLGAKKVTIDAAALINRVVYNCSDAGANFSDFAVRGVVSDFVTAGNVVGLKNTLVQLSQCKEAINAKLQDYSCYEHFLSRNFSSDDAILTTGAIAFSTFLGACVYAFFRDLVRDFSDVNFVRDYPQSSDLENLSHEKLLSLCKAAHKASGDNYSAMVVSGTFFGVSLSTAYFAYYLYSKYGKDWSKQFIFDDEYTPSKVSMERDGDIFKLEKNLKKVDDLIEHLNLQIAILETQQSVP